MVLDVVRQNVPYVAIDVPHLWTTWSKRLLLLADEIVITAAPDLANLRNAKNMVDLLKQHRKNDSKPHLVLNTLGMPKRPEIPIKDFSTALEIAPKIVIDFDAESFGMASNNGQMIEEATVKAKSAQQFRDLALILTHRIEPKVEKTSRLQFLSKLKLKR
jgi:pilus assembly protein CpaE